MVKKLSQIAAIAYYRNLLQVSAAISPKLAAKKAFRLFCTPYSGKPKRTVPELFTHAEALEIIHKNLVHRGFKFTPKKQNNSKKILICHGFDSCCFKFHPYIQPLLLQGFEVYLFDATGHGNSDGKYLHSLLYAEFIIDVDAQLGNFQGIIAHSIGGLATSLAMQKLLQAQPDRKFVLLAPATEATTALGQFYKMFPLNNATKKEINALIYGINRQTLSWYSVNRALQKVTAPILWFHDEGDKICSISDTLPTQQAKYPNVEMIVTRGLGHSKIYKEPSTVEKTVQFLTQG